MESFIDYMGITGVLMILIGTSGLFFFYKMQERRNSYLVSEQLRQLVITITAPSCSGKSYLVNRLVTKYGDRFERAKSITTRERRPGDGDDYEFVSVEEFEALRHNHELIEFNEFNGNFYGRKYSELDRIFKSNKVPLLIVDPNGLKQTREFGIENELFITLSLYIDETLDVLLDRWTDRRIKFPEINAEYFNKRVSITIHEEINWINDGDYDIIQKSWSSNEEELIEELAFIQEMQSRIVEAGFAVVL